MNSEAGNEQRQGEVIARTQSLCPVCLKRLGAEIVLQGGRYFMEKSCPEHGAFRTILWNGEPSMEQWAAKKSRAAAPSPPAPAESGCPYACGLCGGHRQHTCTALIEVTQGCNLHCRFCFASSGAPREEDPSAGQIGLLYRRVLETSGKCNLQLSGGEPTLRDDLPQLVRSGKNLGFPFIQVNTNGLRLAQDEKFAEALKAAGLDSVFLQFDGTKDAVYRELRGSSLLGQKIKAIENCGKYGIGVVLVPTLVPGINTDDIGGIIEFALGRIDTVRGVHFQPVSYFGRTPKLPEDRERITLPEVMAEIERQTRGKIKAESFKPPQCENPLCSFHGNFLYRRDGRLEPLSESTGCCCETAEEGAEKSKAFVSKNWAGRQQAGDAGCCGQSGWDEILGLIRSHSFFVSAMAFQDVWNLDLERLRDCCIHVVSPQGKLIPFCIYNLTDAGGKTLYRSRS